MIAAFFSPLLTLAGLLAGGPHAVLAQAGLAPSGLVPSGLVMLAAVTLTGALIALLAVGSRLAAAVTARPLRGRSAAFREKSWRAGFLPQRDPDAAGRARPRAPTAAPAAA